MLFKTFPLFPVLKNVLGIHLCVRKIGLRMYLKKLTHFSVILHILSQAPNFFYTYTFPLFRIMITTLK